MPPPPPLLLLLCTAAAILVVVLSAASATTIGVAYNPSSPNLPSPDRIVSSLLSLRIPAVQLLDPTPAAVRAFAYTNISLLLSVPNRLVINFAANRSSAAQWVRSLVLPFYPRARISLISAGSDVITTASITDPTLDTSTALLPAIRNLHRSLTDLGIRTIAISTTFSFIEIMTTSFPPSAAEFQEPVGSLIIRPFLQFLEETNSSFLINAYPYNVYRINSEIPTGFALFQEHPFNFRDDVITGVRYRNLFDMMVDAVIAAMAVSGLESIPVIVAQTGWPSEAESHAGGNYAEMYIKGLIAHLRSGSGTPLRKEGATEVYIYELFDDGGELSSRSDLNDTVAAAFGRGAGAGQHWGIMYPNMTMKYDIDFSGSTAIFRVPVEMASTYVVCVFLHLTAKIL